MTDRLTSDQRAGMRRCAEAATPGPWSVQYEELGPAGSPDTRLCAFVMSADERYIVVDEEPDATDGEPSPNAAHIAACCPTSILAVLDENDELRRQRDELREDLNAVKDQPVWAAQEIATLRSLVEEMAAAMEPFARADRAIGTTPGPFRFETSEGYRTIEREDLRTAARVLASYRALSEGGAK